MRASIRPGTRQTEQTSRRECSPHPSPRRMGSQQPTPAPTTEKTRGERAFADDALGASNRSRHTPCSYEEPFERDAARAVAVSRSRPAEARARGAEQEARWSTTRQIGRMRLSPAGRWSNRPDSHHGRRCARKPRFGPNHQSAPAALAAGRVIAGPYALAKLRGLPSWAGARHQVSSKHRYERTLGSRHVWTYCPRVGA